MQLTWTYYPKGEPNSVTLTVVYVPELDAETLPSGGFLDWVKNVAYVDWTTYRIFDTGELAQRQDAFKRLTTVEKGGGVRLPNGHRIAFP